MDKRRKVSRPHVNGWSKSKPTAVGAYWVRGYRGLDGGLVEVFYTGGELACNIHCHNTDDLGNKVTDISYLSDLSDDFEWVGPLFEYRHE